MNSIKSWKKTVVFQLKKIESKKEYADLLKAFYGFYLPTEKMILRYINSSHLEDFPTRRKAEKLLNDIISIVEVSDDIQECQTIPEITGLAQAAGVMYVLEGSTLGGQIISKMLNTKLNLNNKSLCFFSAYGDSTMQKWSEFTEFLNELTLDTSKENNLLTAAKDTFVLLDKWMKERL